MNNSLFTYQTDQYRTFRTIVQRYQELHPSFTLIDAVKDLVNQYKDSLYIEWPLGHMPCKVVWLVRLFFYALEDTKKAYVHEHSARFFRGDYLVNIMGELQEFQYYSWEAGRKRVSQTMHSEKVFKSDSYKTIKYINDSLCAPLGGAHDAINPIDSLILCPLSIFNLSIRNNKKPNDPVVFTCSGNSNDAYDYAYIKGLHTYKQDQIGYLKADNEPLDFKLLFGDRDCIGSVRQQPYRRHPIILPSISPINISLDDIRLPKNRFDAIYRCMTTALDNEEPKDRVSRLRDLYAAAQKEDPTLTGKEFAQRQHAEDQLHFKDKGKQRAVGTYEQDLKNIGKRKNKK